MVALVLSVPGGRAERIAARVVARPGAAEVIDPPDPVTGRADGFLAELRRRGATLVVIEAPGHSRPVGIVRGAAATFVVHEAPCSVLVAHEDAAGAAWPRSIVVGVDGSAQSKRALEAARELAARHGSSLRAVAATRHAHVELDAARELAPELEEHADDAVDLLTLLSEDADLLVVGSRGLTGVRSLGSVSERVAHDARCPVLVVRTQAP